MGMFDFLKGKKESNKEATKIIDGYEIGAISGTIYHCPIGRKEYIIPEGAKRLSDEAFREMRESIETLYTPSSFKEVDFARLGVANKLKSVRFAEGIEKISLRRFSDQVTFNVPQSVTHLSKDLYNTSTNGKVVIGDNVSSIDSDFASHDLTIRTVEISGHLKSIPERAFNQCRNLECVVLHEGVTKCGMNAFRGTNKLRMLELPNSFEGKIDANMEKREVSTKKVGKIYSYTTDNYQEEENSQMTIKINRQGKCHTFQVRRGDFRELEIKGNIISFNGNEICDISTLDSNNIYSLEANKLTSATLPQTRREQFMNSIEVNTPQQKQDTPPTLADLEPTAINVQKAKKVKSHILDHVAPLGGIRQIDEELLSTEESKLLAIALHIECEYYKRINAPAYKMIREHIQYLEDEAIIPDYKTIKSADTMNNGIYRKRFDNAVNQLEIQDER